MTDRRLIVLAFKRDRDEAHRLIDAAPTNSRVEVKEPKRSLPQNDRLWAHLTDIAEQATHYGQRLTTNDWKILFMDALNREARMVPALEGAGWVNLGRSSSDLSKPEMADLITLVEAWSARNGIELNDSSKGGRPGEPAPALP